MKKIIFVVIFFLILIISSSAFALPHCARFEVGPGRFEGSPCIEIVGPVRIDNNMHAAFYLKLRVWSFEDETCRFCFFHSAAFRFADNHTFINCSPGLLHTWGVTAWDSRRWVPRCGMYNFYTEVFLSLPVPHENKPACGMLGTPINATFYGQVMVPVEGGYLGVYSPWHSLSYNAFPIYPDYCLPFVGFPHLGSAGGLVGRGKGSGAVLKFRGVGFKAGGVKGGGVTGYEIRYE